MNHSPTVSSKEYKDNSTIDEAMALQFYPPPSTHQVIDQAPRRSSLPGTSTNAHAMPETLAQSARGNSSIDVPPDVGQSIHMQSTIARPLVLNIANHPQNELIVMLSSLLSKITYSNDNIHSGPEPVSPLKPNSPLLAFHARNIPSISIQSYLTRILKYCPMSSDIFLSLLVYFDRMSHIATEDKPQQVESTFTSTRQLMGDEQHPLSIDSYNVHRLVITGIVVASKFCSDVFYTNSRYAKVCHYVLAISKLID